MAEPYTVTMGAFSTLSIMTAQAVIHRYFPALYLALVAVLGCAGGWLATVVLGIWMSPPVKWVDPGPAAPVATAWERPLSDFQIILDRNIFNSGQQTAAILSGRRGPPLADAAAETGEGQQAPAAQRKDLILVGTVAAGPDSLAVIRQGKETRVYHLGEQVGGATIEEISRSEVVLLNSDGTRESLSLLFDPVALGANPPPESGDPLETATTAPAAHYDIKQVGENRWLIPRETADQARSNLNELLKQARLEPRIIAEQTDGFIVRMIRPNSFLAMLGLRRGDVVKEINNVQLNSPEQALQIFQQLREARSIRVAFLRNEKPMIFEYEID